MSAATLPLPYEPVPVTVAEIAFPGRWPANLGPRHLRGAVLEQLRRVEGDSLHSDWHGHQNGPDGGMNRPAPVCFRVGRDGRPRLWIAGQRAGMHAALVARSLRSVAAPSGGVIDLGDPDIDLRTENASTARQWTVYRLETPLYPTHTQWKRRPRDNDPDMRAAWVSACLRSVMLAWMTAHGVTDSPSFPIHVAARDIQEVSVQWARPQRHITEYADGFFATVTTNAVLPDGVGLGHHRSEGFGELRRVRQGVYWGDGC